MRVSAHHRGFSLVELLVVLAILLVLLVLGSSQFSASARKRDLANCQKNLQKIYVALNLFRNDTGAFPFETNAETSEVPFSDLVPKCTTDTAVFICPGGHDKPLPEGERFDNHRVSYAYYMGWFTNDAPDNIIVTDWQVDSLAKKKGQLLFSLDSKKPGNNHYAEGGNLLSCGGEVTHSRPLASRDLPLPAHVRLLNP